MSDVLVVLKDRGTMAILSNLLKAEGYSVQGAFTREDGEKNLSQKEFRLLIVGLDTPTEDDALIGWVRDHALSTPIILLADRKTAPQITRLDQIFHLLPLPLKIDALLSQVQKAIDFKTEAPTQDVINLNFQLENVYNVKGLIAESPAMKSICDLIGRVSSTDVPVLIVGGQGTGKERIARIIHDGSRRKDGPFLAMDAEDPTTYEDLLTDPVAFFAGINGGTLFLQRPEVLAEKLRNELKDIFQTRTVPKSNGERVPVDLRVISGTSVDLDAWSAHGKFDAEFLRFLRVIVLRVPALKDRRQDMLPLLRDILRTAIPPESPLPDVTREAMAAIEGYPWPGNLRELDEAVRHALANLQGNQIQLKSLPPLVQKSAQH